jgi:hypothetical protein
MADHTPDELARFWDAFLADSDAQPRSVDPTLVETVRRFAALPDQEPARSSFVSRLGEDLMHTHAAQANNAAVTVPPVRLLRRREPHALSAETLVRSERRPSRWLSPVLVAAMVVLVLGVSLDQSGWHPGDGRSGHSAIVAPGTPAPAATDETLVEVPVPANLVPVDSLAAIGMAEITIPPGTYQQTPDEASGNPGVLATYILEGTVTVVSNEAMQVIRAGGAGVVTDVPAGTDIVLQQGDTLITHKSPDEQWINAGPADVQLIAMEIYGGPAGTSSFPQAVRTDSGPGELWTNNGYDYEINMSLPRDEPMVLRLRIVTVPADTILPLPANAIIQVARPVGDTSFGDRSNGEIRLFGGDGEMVSGYLVTLEYVDERLASPVAQTSPTP